jgi:hypothetical protein
MPAETIAAERTTLLTDRELIKARIRESVRAARALANAEQELIIRLQTATGSERPSLVSEIQSIQLAWERQVPYRNSPDL